MRRLFFLAPFVVRLATACGGSPPPGAVAATPMPKCGPADAGPPAIAAPREPSLEETKDEIVKRLNAGDSTGLYAMFSSQMKTTFPPPVLAQLVEGVKTSKGTITSTQRTHDAGDQRSATYAAKAEKVDWRLQLHVDDARQIIRLA